MSFPTELPQGPRPVVGVLFGFQMFGTGQIYGFIDSLTRGIRAGTQDRHCNLLMACGVSRLDPEIVRPAWPVFGPETDFVPVGPWNTNGLIVVHPLNSAEQTQYISELKASGFPIVFVGTSQGGPAINLDSEGGIRQAFMHLVHHGHRQIAFIGGFPNDDVGDSGARLRAFHDVAHGCGIEIDPRLVTYGYHHIVGGRTAMQKILATDVPFTAVIASNDESALGAMQMLTEAGLRVPQDVAVIGFDNRPDGGYELPPLTTVHHPIFERGYRAAELLIDFIEGRRPRGDTVVTVPTRLVRRRSCGCTLQDILPRIEKDSSSASTPGSLADIQERLAQQLTASILNETLHSDPIEIHELSGQLIDALALSLTKGSETDFLCTLQAVLQRVEQLEMDAGVWAFAIDALEAASATVMEHLGGKLPSSTLTGILLHRARIIIAASKRRQHWSERHTAAEVTGYLIERLLAAREETQILTILAEHAPKIGIRRSAIVLFEPETNDPVAWSIMRTSMHPDGQPVRFRSRDFPPMGYFVPDEDGARLALVPLVIQSDISGYMVLEADNLAACASVRHAVNTALKSARMYHDVVETSRMYHDAVEHRRAAEEANSLKSRFLSVVGHELRTPLSLILSASEFLEKEKVDPEGVYTRNLAHIRASAQHLDGLVRDVLDLTRNELGQLRLTCEPIDLATTLEPVAAVGEQLSRAKGLKWRAEIPDGLPNVWADRARLRQVALNLVTNAVKFTTQGEVVLRVQNEDRRVVVAVRDTGMGVPVEEQELIFNEFQQSSRPAARNNGLGLGLAICKRLIEMHAGEVGVLSSGQKESGSTFFFTLPTLKIGAEKVARSLPRQQPVFTLEEGNATDTLYRHLQEQGFSVQRLRADDLSVLLSTLSSTPAATVLVDVDAASGNSWKTVKLLKDNALTRAVSVMFYSVAAPTAVAPPLKLDYLTKPIGTMDLARALQRRGLSDKGKAITVLVVEDDPGLLDMHVQIVETLTTLNRVLKASNGKEALPIIQQELPDLVLLDLIMPEMDGFAVLDAMQEHETTRHIPVIVLSGQTLTDEEMGRLNRGVTAVLTKGVFTVEETLSHVQEALNNDAILSGEAQRLVRKAMAYIHKHYGKPLTRKMIAAHLNISEDHLTRCFRQTLRIPLMTYLTRYRVNRAKTLLDEGKQSVAAIAAAVGFSNEFHFSQVFRTETGIAPSAYRRERRLRN